MKTKISVKHKIVSDIMSQPVKIMTPLMTVREAIKFLIAYRLSGAPLVDHQGNLLSIVSELDLMKIGALDGPETRLSESEARLPKKEDLISIKPDEPFVNLFRLFLEKNIRRVLVIDEAGKVVGIVARRDILKSYIEEDDEKA
jgi:predicted transcriptional regulator